jgi:hypothetical protein
LPDFSDCRFASREADADWSTIASHGGSIRGFSQMMPAFGDALTPEQILSAINYIRGFCKDNAWPRGELNLPRPLVTEKAFPEDEAVVTTSVAAEGPASIVNTFVYEKRFGANNQIEFGVPVIARRPADGGVWNGGLGDVALAFKRSIFHSLRTGSIFTLGGEVAFPTGNKDKDLGGGATVFEPFAAFGQILPSEGFLHLQGGAELPTHSHAKEAFGRLAIGRSFVQDFGAGRAWTPMIEFVGARELESGAHVEWDAVPQFQVTLNKRQHIMLNLGARLPISNTGGRHPQVMMYLLWDWFDGGLRDGW